jgi:hypothetical protein
MSDTGKNQRTSEETMEAPRCCSDICRQVAAERLPDCCATQIREMAARNLAENWKEDMRRMMLEFFVTEAGEKTAEE